MGSEMCIRDSRRPKTQAAFLPKSRLPIYEYEASAAVENLLSPDVKHSREHNPPEATRAACWDTAPRSEYCTRWRPYSLIWLVDEDTVNRVRQQDSQHLMVASIQGARPARSNPMDMMAYVTALIRTRRPILHWTEYQMRPRL